MTRALTLFSFRIAVYGLGFIVGTLAEPGTFLEAALLLSHLKDDSDFFNKISKTGKGIDHFVHPVKSESSARALDIFITGVFTLDTHIHFDRGDLPIIPDVMALCERFATPAIRRHTVTRLHQMCKDDPWRIFCLASQLQDEELAKKAIRFMHETEGPENQLDDLTSEESRGLSVDYLLALIRCRLGYNGDGSYRKTVKWKQVAIDFETSRFDRSVGSLYL